MLPRYSRLRFPFLVRFNNGSATHVHRRRRVRDLRPCGAGPDAILKATQGQYGSGPAQLCQICLRQLS